MSYISFINLTYWIHFVWGMCVCPCVLVCVSWGVRALGVHVHVVVFICICECTYMCTCVWSSDIGYLPIFLSMLYCKTVSLILLWDLISDRVANQWSGPPGFSFPLYTHFRYTPSFLLNFLLRIRHYCKCDHAYIINWYKICVYETCFCFQTI